MISVLYIDDTPGLLKEVKQFLERTGSFTVDTAISGTDALDLLAHTGYDVVISAYEMTGMSGLELLSHIREKNASIPFIFITNVLPNNQKGDGVNLEADYIIQRSGSPIQIYEELSFKIHRTVKRRRREQEFRKRSQKKENQKNPFQEGFWVINAEGFTIYGGEEIAIILGFPLEELWKRDLFSLMTVQEKSRMKLSLEKARESSIQNFELELILGDLMPKIILSEEVRVFVDDLGGDLFAFSGLSEVTHLKQTKSILEQYVVFCDLLLTNMNGVLWTLNTVTMTFQYISPSARHFYGQTAEDLMKRHIDGGEIFKTDLSLSDIIWERAVCHLSTDNPPDFYTDIISQYRNDGHLILTEIISEYYLNKEKDLIMVRGFTSIKSNHHIDECEYLQPEKDECQRQEMEVCLNTLQESAESLSQITKDDHTDELLEKLYLLKYALIHKGIWPPETREIVKNFRSIRTKKER